MDSTRILPLMEVPDLVETKILEYLTVKEVLHFRLVSHSTFDWVLRYKPHLQKRLKYKRIYLETEEEIHSFVTCVDHIPFTRFYFRFNPSKLSESEDIQQFMKKFSPSVTFLYVRDMNLCLTDGELAFYESLTSLESLRIDKINVYLELQGNPFGSSESELLEAHSRLKSDVAKARIPQNPLKTLKRFMFSTCNCSAYAFDLVRSCPNLKQFSPGDLSWRILLNPGRHPEPLMELEQYGIKKLMEYFEERKSRGKFDFEFDFEHNLGMMNRDDMDLRRSFLKCLGDARVRLTNFGEHILYCLLEETGFLPQELEKVLASVCSLTGISPRVKGVELQNLEELNFTTDQVPCDSNVYVKDWNESPTVYPLWPNLRKINGRVESFGIWEEWEEPDGPPIDDVVQIAAMIDFVFRCLHKRTAVKEIDFFFEVNLENPLTPEHFVTNFPNLEILSLNIHSFKKEDYSKLFQLLGKDTKIKRLKLWTEVLFDDETFTGPSVSDGKNQVPYFSTMKHLEVFKLGRHRWDESVAVGITDKLFTDVLAGMSLKSLKITGHGLDNLTWNGVEKLINGRFGEKIQKFVVELADAPQSEERTKYAESLKKLMMRCEFNSRFREPKRTRLYCNY